MRSVVYGTTHTDKPAPSEDTSGVPAQLLPGLSDLVHANGVSTLDITNPWCCEARELRRHGLARWSASGPTGQWVATELGWTFLANHTRSLPDEAA